MLYIRWRIFVLGRLFGNVWQDCFQYEHREVLFGSKFVHRLFWKAIFILVFMLKTK